MSVPPFSESIIRRHASAESFRRGQDYYSQGAVLSIVQRGNMIEAKVEGSSPRPYTVRCSFDEHNEPHASCTCPYTWGGWCKHIVATFLTILQEPELIEERPTLETLLSNLDREQLQALLLKLAERDSSLPDVIESLLVRSTSATGERPVPLTAAMVRRQVQAAFQERAYPDDDDDYDDYDDYHDYWDDEENDSAALTALDEILDRIRALITADEGYSALLPLQSFTSELLSQWDTLDHESEMPGELLAEVGQAWTEALLST